MNLLDNGFNTWIMCSHYAKLWIGWNSLQPKTGSTLQMMLYRSDEKQFCLWTLVQVPSHWFPLSNNNIYINFQTFLFGPCYMLKFLFLNIKRLYVHNFSLWFEFRVLNLDDKLVQHFDYFTLHFVFLTFDYFNQSNIIYWQKKKKIKAPLLEFNLTKWFK